MTLATATAPTLMPNLLLLTRVPAYGQVKSRLAEHIGKPQALRAHVQLLQQNVRIAAASGLPLQLHVAGDTRHSWLQKLAAELGARIVPQAEGDIGDRMLAAIGFVSAETRPPETGASLVIGSDCGDLSVDYLRLAQRELESADVVLGPAEDGGYVLIGQHRAHPELFRSVEWGGSLVAQQTRERARDAGLKLTELPSRWDVDGASDYLRWRHRTESRAAPGTDL